MRNEIKRKIRGLGSAALEELNQPCCTLFSVNEADSRPRHFTLTFRCQQHGKYWLAVQYIEDIPDDLIKTDIKIEVLNRAFSAAPNGGNKNSNGSSKKASRAGQ